MSWIGKYWKVLLAVVLLIAAVLILVRMYFPEKAAYEVQVSMAEVLKTALQSSIQEQQEENRELAAIKDEIGPALREVEAASEQLAEDRETLYGNFPGDMLEEDQILYVMDLEDILDMEVMFGRVYDSLSGSQSRDTVFEFGAPLQLRRLTDNSTLYYTSIKIDFDMPYEAFKQMLVYLANDERITSINYTKIDYDTVNGRVVGFATLMYYFLDAVPYEAPVIDGQETGKRDLFR